METPTELKSCDNLRLRPTLIVRGMDGSCGFGRAEAASVPSGPALMGAHESMCHGKHQVKCGENSEVTRCCNSALTLLMLMASSGVMTLCSLVLCFTCLADAKRVGARPRFG